MPKEKGDVDDYSFDSWSSNIKISDQTYGMHIIFGLMRLTYTEQMTSRDHFMTSKKAILATGFRYMLYYSQGILPSRKTSEHLQYAYIVLN